MLGFTKNNKNDFENRVVWSCNEWDPLEEVIVGRVDGAIVPSWDEVSLRAIVPGHAKWFFEKHGGKPFPEEMIQKATAELDGLVEVFQSLGIVVHRPEITDHSIEYTTPWWKSCGLYSAMPRDVLLVVGDTIIEAPMAWRNRYFESFAFRPLIESYFKKGARWLTAPKPSMNDNFFNKDYDPDNPRIGNQKQFVITNNEVAFDAADFVRLGKDIVVQKSNVTNEKGIEWVRRHLDSDYTVHEFEFEDDNPMHIDTTIVPLAPRLLLINPSYVNKENLPAVFKNWEIIEAPAPSKPFDSAMYFSSDWLTINFLVVGHKKAIVEENEVALIELLKKHGFEIIPIPFRNFYPFGGSIHCATSDIRRRGNLKSYR
jgi:glycine amidinotransferase